MPALTFNTRFEPSLNKHKYADGSDAHYGTPADMDYLERYPDVAEAVASQRASGGTLTSGYVHFQMAGQAEGRLYDTSLNKLEDKPFLKKYLPYIAGAVILVGVYLLYKKFKK